MDPGSSAGRSGVDGRDTERGRLGRGLCMEADLGQAVALNAGERKMSLTAANKLEAELTRAAL